MTERSLPEKSPEAYRTIGEAAEELRLPQHVLRFWETRFPQVKPLKRAGGRRFYRPDDVALLAAIKTLLYGQGYTIKGVQRLLQDRGARALVVAGANPIGPGRARPAVVDILAGQGAAVEAGPVSQTRDPVAERATMRDDDTNFLSFEAPEPTHPQKVDGGRGPEPWAGGAASHGGPPPRQRAPDIVARLEALAFELGECQRLLAVARSPRS